MTIVSKVETKKELKITNRQFMNISGLRNIFPQYRVVGVCG